MTFIIRASIDLGGRLHGVIVHAQTGRKERFDDASQLGALIKSMAGRPALAGAAQIFTPRSNP